MATMNVSLPDPMKEWVESRARSGRFSDASDYVRDLIRQDQERSEALADIQSQIDAGFESGVSDRSMEDVRESAREHVRTMRGA